MREELEDGPRSCEDLKAWPRHLAEGLCGQEADAEISHRLHANLLKGIAWTGDYSGMDCVRESAEMGLA